MILSIVLATCFFLEVGMAHEERKIVGGNAPSSEFLDKTDFIFNVVIKHNATREGQCGAILIARPWILTAAHCVQGVDTRSIQVGPYYGIFEDMVKSIFKHPHYDGDNNDIALLHLNKLVYTKSVKIATTPPPTNTKCTLIGKGRTSKNHSKIPYLSSKMKKVDMYTTRCGENVLFDPNNWGRYKEKSFLCASTEDGRGACFGDTGGALLWEETPGKYTVVGIVSNGIACATGVPDIFTEVSFYNKWIYDTMKRHN